MPTFVLTANNDAPGNSAGNDIYDGYGPDNGVGATGGVDTLDGGAGNDLFILDSDSAGTLQGGSGIDTVRFYGPRLGSTTYSGVEILDLGFAFAYGTASQFNSFSTIKSTAFPTQQLQITILGDGGNIDFSTRMTGTNGLHLLGFAATGGITAIGTANDDQFEATDFNDNFTGGNGNDTFVSLDIFQNYTGSDTFDGGIGNDTFYLSNQAGFIQGGIGTDTVIIGSDQDPAFAPRGDMGLATYAGVEILDLRRSNTFGTLAQFSTFSSIIDASDPARQIGFVLTGAGGTMDFSTRVGGGDTVRVTSTILSSGIVLTGTGGDDALGGTNFNDTLNGGGGNDEFYGNVGDDVMNGNLGDDQFFADVGADRMNGGGGSDTVSYAGSWVGATVSLATGFASGGLAQGDRLFEIENVRGTTYNDVLVGSSVSNQLYGQDGNDLLDGLAGTDTMVGGRGNDYYVVDNSGDVVREDTPGTNGGFDTVLSHISFSLQSANVIGEVENVMLLGAANLNATGNARANLIVGNSGSNTLTGGGGNDTFRFASALGGSNIDTITDLSAAERIQLDDAVFAGLATGVLAASAFAVGASATTADHRIVYNNLTGTLSFDEDGSGAGAAIQFATVTAGLALSNTNFLVF